MAAMVLMLSRDCKNVMPPTEITLLVQTLECTKGSRGGGALLTNPFLPSDLYLHRVVCALVCPGLYRKDSSGLAETAG